MPMEVSPSQQDDQPRAERRSARLGRRQEDRQRLVREAIATVLALCGALSVIYFAVAALGAVGLKEAAAASIIALVLAALWVLGVWQRARTGGAFVTRTDRERRGF